MSEPITIEPWLFYVLTFLATMVVLFLLYLLYLLGSWWANWGDVGPSARLQFWDDDLKGWRR